MVYLKDLLYLTTRSLLKAYDFFVVVCVFLSLQINQLRFYWDGDIDKSEGIESCDSMPSDDCSGGLTILVNKNAQMNAPKLVKGVFAYEPIYAMVDNTPNSRIDQEVIAPLSK